MFIIFSHISGGSIKGRVKAMPSPQSVLVLMKSHIMDKLETIVNCIILCPTMNTKNYWIRHGRLLL